jgi:membrane protein YqaA with SNARE-associated domain
MTTSDGETANSAVSDNSFAYTDVGLGVWAFLESIVWFIAADYLLFLYGVRQPSRWRRYLTVVTLMSGVGIVVHFTLLAFFPETMESLLRSTPFVQPWMFETVSSYLADSVWLAAVQPFTLIAVKVWTYTVATSNISFAAFLVLVMIGRVTRWGVVLTAAKSVNWLLDDLVDDYYWAVILAWTLFFAVVMVLGEL